VIRVVILLNIILSSFQLSASPSPMTSTSKAVAPFWGLMQSPGGYVLDTRKTNWRVAETPEGAERAEAAFRIPDTEGLLTVRLDESKKARNPKSYMDSFMTLYHRLGFDVLGTRPFEQNGDTAYVIDLLQKDRGRQARQAVFFRGTQAVIISCHDLKEKFTGSLSECNKVIRSFRWSRPNLQSPTL
jgi:hypothetical protein